MTYCNFSGRYLRDSLATAEQVDAAWVARAPLQYGNRKGPFHAWDS
jgi:hypothetical protein